MSGHYVESRSQTISEKAIQVLEEFSLAAKIPFDRISASRSLVEAKDSILGEDWQAWSHRLIEAGDSLGLRILSPSRRKDMA